ncbi:DUF7544 domain-containing protein [Natrarchaeobius oligotrophus]|uniref:Glycerophosphoryl diester phosphodiesterase membrane domain-containing protein n=1 Tax=Natrarchaeobius chitinivorans TaxID=1679083 RepID=A0A3N6PLX2_NATCH|nr:hypothetical protein [Natrarchaeobius chitinivorans]RQH00026.1 hypothetical protein EA472_12475 [Natrarchaeobius chitinivorans]
MDAVDDLSDAIDVTRNLLLPIRAKLWLKLAVVVFFVGGMGMSGGTPPTGDVTMFAENVPGDVADEGLDAIPEDVLLIAGAIIVVVLVLWLLFALLGALMEFVFIESLRSNEVHIRRYAKENLGRGLRLFGFRLVLGLAAFSVVVVPLVFLFLSAPDVETVVGSLLLLALFWIAVFLVYAVVMRFTSEFVAPIMLLESRGVLDGWRRFLSTFKANWSEYVVYLLLVWILQLVINFAAGILILFAAIIVAIPFVIIGIGLLALGDVGLWLAIPVAIVAFLLILLVVALIETPIRSYFQYYALLLLGDTDAELDLIPEQRAEVRSDGGESVDRDDEPPTGDRWDDEARRDDGEDRWDDDTDSSYWDEPDEGSDWDDDRDDRDRGW